MKHMTLATKLLLKLTEVISQDRHYRMTQETPDKRYGMNFPNVPFESDWSTLVNHLGVSKAEAKFLWDLKIGDSRKHRIFKIERIK